MSKPKKLSKANKRIIQETLSRWSATINEGAPDVAKAKEFLIAAYNSGLGTYRTERSKRYHSIDFYVVESPLSFYIAVGVIRGRMTKEYAKNLCQKAHIDSRFLRDLRRDSLLNWNRDASRWWRNTNSNFTRTWLRAIHEEFLENEKAIATNSNLNGQRWFSPRQQNDARSFGLNSLDLFSPILFAQLSDYAGLGTEDYTITNWQGQKFNQTRRVIDKTISEIAQKLLPSSNTTTGIMGSILNAIDIGRFIWPNESDEEDDGNNNLRIINGQPRVVDAEILCRLLGVNDAAITWEFEVFHHLTAFAAFQKSCVILANRPTMRRNESNNLHNEAGPAIEWADGVKLYFNDGHFMNEYGNTIVEKPQALTSANILHIRNEETRRLAIDKFGWDKFLAETDCQILDRRENEIDNTIEMLVSAPSAVSGAASMVLFCRSTGRRYFIGVPRGIDTCEAAQNWLAAAGTTTATSYAKNPIRVIGAS